MITIQSRVYVTVIGGNEITRFLLNPTDAQYQKWWPGTHIGFHVTRHCPNHVGDMVYMDEFVGDRRVKMTAIVIEAKQTRRITWQFKKLIRLPVKLTLELEEDKDGVAITHTITAGFNGVGSILDPVLRTYFSDEFSKAIDENAKIEFPRLRDMLAPSPTA